MEHSTRGIGSMTSSTEWAKRVGLMAQCITANTSLVKSTGRDCIAGMMGQDMRENGMKIRSKDWEHTPG